MQILLGRHNSARPADLDYESIWLGCQLLSAESGNTIPWNLGPLLCIAELQVTR